MPIRKRLFKILILIFSCLTLTSGLHAQRNLQLYRPAELKSDIDSLVAMIEQTHPNPYYRYPKKAFYKNISMAKQLINKPLTSLDFYQVIEPVLVRFQDGHTDLSMPLSEFYDIHPNPFKLPFKLKFSVKKPYIIFQEAISSSLLNNIPRNSEIISINSVPSAKIINDLIEMTAGESPEFRLAYGSSFLGFHLKQLYNIDSSYTISYATKEGVKKISVKGIREKELDALRLKEHKVENYQAPYALTLIYGLNTAIIDC